MGSQQFLCSAYVKRNPDINTKQVDGLIEWRKSSTRDSMILLAEDHVRVRPIQDTAITEAISLHIALIPSPTLVLSTSGAK